MFDAVFIRDHAELTALCRILGEDARALTFLTPDPLVVLACDRHALRARVLSDPLTRDESYALYDRAWLDAVWLTDTLPPVADDLRLNLGRFFRMDYWEYLSELYALDLALRRLFDHGQVHSLAWFARCFEPPTRHRDLVHAGRLIEHVLTAWAADHPDRLQKLIPDCDLNPPARTLPSRLLAASARLTRSVIAAAGNAIPNRAALPAPQPRAIAFGSGYDSLIVIHDALRIARESSLVPLWMTEHVDTATTRSGLRYDPAWDRIERFSISRFLAQDPAPTPTTDQLAQADRAFDEFLHRLEEIPEIARYQLAPTLAPLRADYRAALRRAQQLDHVLRRFPGSSLALTHYNGLDERAIEQLAPHHHIHTVARPHGWIANVEGFEFRADTVYASGELSRRVLESFYGPDLRPVLSPDPGLLDASSAWLALPADRRAAEAARLRRALNISAPHVLLLMTTAARRVRLLNEFDLARLRASWDAVLDLLARHPDLHLVIKSHKNNYDDWFRETAAARSLRNLTVLTGRLEDALILADLAIDFGKPGTATLTALLFRRPLLLYRGLYKYVRQQGDLVHDAAGAALVETARDLTARCQAWLAEPDETAARLLDENRRLLSALAEGAS